LYSHLPPRSTLFPYTTLFRSQKRPRSWSAPIQEQQSRKAKLHHADGSPRGFGLHQSSRGVRRKVGNHGPQRRFIPLLQCRHSRQDRKSTRLNSSHVEISYAVF